MQSYGINFGWSDLKSPMSHHNSEASVLFQLKPLWKRALWMWMFSMSERNYLITFLIKCSTVNSSVDYTLSFSFFLFMPLQFCFPLVLLSPGLIRNAADSIFYSLITPRRSGLTVSERHPAQNYLPVRFWFVILKMNVVSQGRVLWTAGVAVVFLV